MTADIARCPVGGGGDGDAESVPIREPLIYP